MLSETTSDSQRFWRDAYSALVAPPSCLPNQIVSDRRSVPGLIIGTLAADLPTTQLLRPENVESAHSANRSQPGSNSHSSNKTHPSFVPKIERHHQVGPYPPCKWSFREIRCDDRAHRYYNSKREKGLHIVNLRSTASPDYATVCID